MTNNKRQLPTPLMLFARVFVGGYLLYTAYEVFKSGQSGEENAVLFTALAVIFALVGALGTFLGLKDLAKGYYKGGPMDTEDVDTIEADTIEEDASEALDTAAVDTAATAEDVISTNDD